MYIYTFRINRPPGLAGSYSGRKGHNKHRIISQDISTQFWGPPHHSSIKEDNKTLKKKPFGGSQLLPRDKANNFFLDSSLLQMSFDFVTTPNDLKKMHACSIALSLSLALSRRSLALALALAPSIVLALAHHPHTIRTSSTHHPHIICLTRYCS